MYRPWIVTLFSGVFDVTGRKGIRLVAFLYPGKVHIGIYCKYLGLLSADIGSGVPIPWRQKYIVLEVSS